MAALALLLSAPTVAMADDDTGIPLGDLVVKPSLRAEVVYDSNVYREQQSPDADLGLQIVPAVRFLYPGDNFRWELDGYYRFFNYFNVGGINHSDLRDLANFGIGTLFDVNREGKFGFFINPSFYNRRGSRGADTNPRFGSDQSYELGVSVPLEFRIRPTNAFKIGIDGHWDWVRAYHPIFTPSPTVLGQPHDVGGGLSLDWKFFPRSHFLVDADVGHVFQAAASPVYHDAAVENTYWRAKIGMKGDVTRKLSMLGIIGYGNAYLGPALRAKNLTGIEGLIGQAEIALRPMRAHRLALGFSRDFYFRYYAYHVMDMSAYFSYKGVIADRLAISARVVYTFRDLEGDDGGADPGIPRIEHQILAGADVEVLIAPWFHVVAGYWFSAVPAATPGVGEYIDNRVNLGLVLGFR